jgi:hypothetical protein
MYYSCLVWQGDRVVTIIWRILYQPAESNDIDILVVDDVVRRMMGSEDRRSAERRRLLLEERVASIHGMMMVQ